MPDPIEDPQNNPDVDPATGAPQGDPQAPLEDPAPTFQPITSQEDFDKTLGKRLAAERAKYSGFDDLKAKAARYDELEDQKKSNEQRLSEQLTAAQEQVATLKLDQMRNSVAADKGLPAKFARRLTGTTREELEADADDLLDTLPKPETKVPLSQKPKESLRGGGRPDEEPEETDPGKLAARIPRLGR